MSTAARPDAAPREPRAHLRLLPPPDTDPRPRLRAVDATSAATRTTTQATTPTPTPTQQTLPLLHVIPGGRDLPARPESPLDPDSPLDPTDPTDAAGPADLIAHADLTGQTDLADLAEARAWTARLVQAVVEVRHGQRPISQLVRWTSREVHARLTRAAAARSPHRPPLGATSRPLVRSVHVTEIEVDPRTDTPRRVIEACAVVDDGTRSHAVALRGEHRDGRWTCTELELR